MHDNINAETEREILNKFETLYKQGLLKITPKEHLKQLNEVKKQISYWQKNPDLKKLIKIFKALSNKNRLLIFQLICNGIRCSCEIEHVLGLSQSTVSHHLNILIDAGVIEAERSGKWAFVYANTKALSKEFLIQLFEKLIESEKVRN